MFATSSPHTRRTHITLNLLRLKIYYPSMRVSRWAAAALPEDLPCTKRGQHRSVKLTCINSSAVSEKPAGQLVSWSAADSLQKEECKSSSISQYLIFFLSFPASNAGFLYKGQSWVLKSGYDVHITNNQNMEL